MITISEQGRIISRVRPRRNASFAVCSNAVIGGMGGEHRASRVYDELRGFSRRPPRFKVLRLPKQIQTLKRGER